MCTVNEYYNLDLESCLPCSTCADGDTVMVKCSYFEDTVCQKDFWQGFVLLSEPLPTSPYIPRGPGPRTVEVLPEDWTSGPAVSMAMSAFGLSLFVAVIIILGCICKKSWSQKKEKIIYLTRGKISFYSDNSKSCNYITFCTYVCCHQEFSDETIMETNHETYFLRYAGCFFFHFWFCVFNHFNDGNVILALVFAM